MTCYYSSVNCDLSCKSLILSFCHLRIRRLHDNWLFRFFVWNAMWRLEHWTHVTEDSEKKCGILQHAVRLQRVEIMKELIKKWDLNCAGCSETPLGQAVTYSMTTLIITLEVLQRRRAKWRHWSSCSVKKTWRLMEQTPGRILPCLHRLSACEAITFFFLLKWPKHVETSKNTIYVVVLLVNDLTRFWSPYPKHKRMTAYAHFGIWWCKL